MSLGSDWTRPAVRCSKIRAPRPCCESMVSRRTGARKARRQARGCDHAEDDSHHRLLQRYRCRARRAAL